MKFCRLRVYMCALLLIGCSAALKIYTPSSRLFLTERSTRIRAVDEYTHLSWLTHLNMDISSHGNVLYAANNSAIVMRASFGRNLLQVQAQNTYNFDQAVAQCAATTTHVCCISASRAAVACKRISPTGIQLGSDISIVFEEWSSTDLVDTITSGDTHFCLLTVNGSSYCWGSDNRHKKLGVNIDQNIDVLFQLGRRVSLPSTVWKLSCGGDSCVAVSTNRTTMYLWGVIGKYAIMPTDWTHPYTTSDGIFNNQSLTIRAVLTANRTALVLTDSNPNILVFGQLDTGIAGNCDLQYASAMASSMLTVDASHENAVRSLANPGASVHHTESIVIGIAPDKAGVYGWGLNNLKELGTNLRLGSYLCPHAINFATSPENVLPAPDRIVATPIGTLLLYENTV